MDILSQADDVDTFLENDIIVNTMTDNGIDHKDLHTNEEWLEIKPSGCQIDSPTRIHVCDTNAIPPDKWSHHVNSNLTDIRPTCVKILDADDHVKDITAYDAELYTGNNDGDKDHLTNIMVTDPEDISTTDLYTTVNMAQLIDKNKQTFNMDDLEPNLSATKILSIKMNLHQQMDSGANKNVTNDRRIIRNCSNITPIPIFGIGNDDAACHITEKRYNYSWNDRWYWNRHHYVFFY